MLQKWRNIFGCNLKTVLLLEMFANLRKNMQAMKSFTTLLAIAEGGTAQAHLLMQLEWKDVKEIKTLD